MAGNLRFNGDDDVISDINITPFVDVVLVLLVIFMVTAGLIANRGMKVDLPEAASGEKIAGAATFEVLLTLDGKIIVAGSEISLEELKERGVAARQKNPEVVVMIQADRGVIYNSVVKLMDSLRQVGISDFGLALDPVTP